MRILLWNNFFSKADYGFGLGDRSLFEQQGCIVNDCLITDDRGWLWDSAAVVIMPSSGGKEKCLCGGGGDVKITSTCIAINVCF